MDEELPLCTTSTYECSLYAIHWISRFPYDRRGIPTFLVYLRKVANTPQTLEGRKHHPDLGLQLFAYWKRKAISSEAGLPPYYTLLIDDSTTKDVELRRENVCGGIFGGKAVRFSRNMDIQHRCYAVCSSNI